MFRGPQTSVHMTTTGDGENFNPAYETFRKHSADLHIIMQVNTQ